MRNHRERTTGSNRGGALFGAALLVVPAASAWLAFSRSAQQHALDVLLGQGACGNLLMSPAKPEIFGHCIDCWSAGATAGIAAFLAIAAAQRLSERLHSIA